MITRRARRRASTSSTPRPSTATTARARRSSRDVPHASATTSCSRRSAATTSPPSASSRASRSARTTGGPSRCAQQCRRLAAPARHRPHRPATSCTTRASSRSSTTTSGRRCSTLHDRRQGARARRRARPGDRLGRGRQPRRSTTARSSSLQTVFNVLEQEPGPRSRRGRASQQRRGLADLARAARVRHALGQGHARHRVPDPATTARTATATTCSTTSRRPRRSSFLWAAETGRTIGQAAIAGILANPAFTSVLPTVLTVDDVREYAAASDLPLTDDEHRRVDELWSRNFDHADRYVMPLKSSV